MDLKDQTGILRLYLFSFLQHRQVDSQWSVTKLLDRLPVNLVQTFMVMKKNKLAAGRSPLTPLSLLFHADVHGFQMPI